MLPNKALPILAGLMAVLILNPFQFIERAYAASTTIVVGPGAMHGWTFLQEPVGTGTGTGSMVLGPGTPPAGKGSLNLKVNAASDGMLLGLQGYNGVKLADIEELRYWTYRTAGSNPFLAVSLQFVIDKDVTDAVNIPQGRLVFEPYYTAGALPDNTWQEWDAKAGKWWFTHPAIIGTSCTIHTPCFWNDIITAFPNIGIHNTFGAVILKAGSGWAFFDGNADKLTIRVNGESITYDFEPSFYTLTLSDPDATINIGDPMTAFTETNDYTNDTVRFRWFDPFGTEVRTQTVSTVYDGLTDTYKASDTFIPNAVGTWQIIAEFNNGTILITTLDVKFQVVPESVIGALGVAGTSISILAMRRLMRRQ
ncbi:MAG: hypothetical protein RMJ59_03875 [Candidatus Nitrosocaldus sp.]|nr:hypothetical protein [Candidatus Nitrosocaldus sp.]MDW8275504.1 hypothetical protein [Candidatus Nitrosocaldus sp.]